MSAARPPRVDQLLPAAHQGDATGDAAVHLAGALRAAGYEADLYALTVDTELRDTVRGFDEFAAPAAGDLTLLHYALPSSLSEALVECDGRRALVYHNLTPPEMLAPFAPAVARLTAVGREQLQWLADSGRIDLAIGVSEFNTSDLRTTGFQSTTTLPLSIDLSRYDVPGDRILAEQLADAPTIFLSVGRIAPNKRLEDFLRMAAYYLRYIDPDAWFIAIGGNRGLEPYSDALMQLHRTLKLDERVRLVGRVPHDDLVSWYRAARVYVCTSEHEGFCAPLLEAMAFDLPILARAAAAVPETLGDAGLTYTEPDPAAVAEMLHLVATDQPTRARLAAAGRSRLQHFAPERVAGRWLQTVTRLLGSS